MKWIKTSLIAMIFLFAGQGIHSQNKPDSIRTELPSEKGNLYQLTQRIYLAFNAYVWGESKLYKGLEKPEITIHQNGQGIIHDSFAPQTRPRIAIFKNGKKESEGMSDEDLKKIRIDDVKSIEVIHGTDENALYGTSGITCVIKITLK